MGSRGEGSDLRAGFCSSRFSGLLEVLHKQLPRTLCPAEVLTAGTLDQIGRLPLSKREAQSSASEGLASIPSGFLV